MDSPLHISMLASQVNKTLKQAYFWLISPFNPSENITFGFENDSVYVGVRAEVEGGSPGVYGWALIADRDGTARLQVRDEKGGAVTIDLLKAVRVLKRLIDAEDANSNQDVE